jgi:hypothetical protein
MDIRKLLSQAKGKTDLEVLGEVLSNHIDHFAGENIGAVISQKNFEQLSNDLVAWRNQSTQVPTQT